MYDVLVQHTYSMRVIMSKREAENSSGSGRDPRCGSFPLLKSERACPERAKDRRASSRVGRGTKFQNDFPSLKIRPPVEPPMMSRTAKVQPGRQSGAGRRARQRDEGLDSYRR